MTQFGGIVFIGLNFVNEKGFMIYCISKKFKGKASGWPNQTLVIQ